MPFPPPIVDIGSNALACGNQEVCIEDPGRPDESQCKEMSRNKKRVIRSPMTHRDKHPSRNPISAPIRWNSIACKSDCEAKRMFALEKPMFVTDEQGTTTSSSPWPYFAYTMTRMSGIAGKPEVLFHQCVQVLNSSSRGDSTRGLKLLRSFHGLQTAIPR
jgi:hypothetical protein